MKSRLRYFYFIISALYLGLALFDQAETAWYLKPFLLPYLFYLVVSTTNFITKKWLLIALLFSWIGDVILMFADRNELFFILGLVSFLISHIFYIVLFLKQKNEISATKKPLFLLGCSLIGWYLYSMLALLFPTLGTLKIPVAVYAITISIMLIVALKGYFSWKNPSKYSVLLGAVLFVTSDSLLAIDKFYSPLNYSGFTIMVTYLMAQWFIVTGILKLNAKQNEQ